MVGPIHRFLADDHLRLSELLDRALCRPEQIDLTAHAEFRAGLLRHIAMEEKVLLSFAQKKRGGEPLPIAARLRLDHGALAALLVPTPTLGIIATIRTVLERHNPIEEGAGGLYEICEASAGSETKLLLNRLRAVPDVRVSPHSDGPKILEFTKRAVERAGYRLAVCPVYGADKAFLGPAAIALAERYNLDSRDEGRLKREAVVAAPEGAWMCTFVGECTRVCPKDVDPAGAIQRAKLASAQDWWKFLLLPWGESQ
jgi:hypothetical protein